MRLYPARGESELTGSARPLLGAWAGSGRWALLTALGALSLLVYWLGLLLPYNVFALGVGPGHSVGTLTAGRPWAQAGLVLTTAALWGLYLLAWRICRQPEQPGDGAGGAAWPMWGAVLVTALSVAFSLVWLYPIGSADVFDSMAYGRIAVQWHGNPFYQTLSQYNDPLAQYAGWPFATSAYGPLWVMLCALASALAGGDVLANLLIFKLMGLVFYCGCVVVVAALLRRHAPERALAGTCLFALNPLVLYETAGNGHNDIVLAFCLLLLAAALAHRHHTLAVAALTAGVLVKYIPVLLAPLLLAYSLRALPNGRARVRYLLVSAAVGGVLALAAWAPFWRGGDIASIQRRTILFTTSLPAFVETQLRTELDPALSRYLVSRAALVLAVLVAYALGWHTWWRTAFALRSPAGRRRAWLEPIRAGHMLLLFYLMVACLWFQPWYALWPLALAALLPESTLVYLALLLAYAAGWKTLYLDFFISPPHLGPPASGVETVLGPAVLGVTWLYAGLAMARELLARRALPRARPNPGARPARPTPPAAASLSTEE